MDFGHPLQNIERTQMKANPGGVIDPRHVYGRDGLIAELWQRLDQICVLMNAERRIGKTSVLAEDGARRCSRLVSRLARPREGSIRRKSSRSASTSRSSNISARWKKIANAARKIYEEHEFGEFKRTSGRRPGRHC